MEYIQLLITKILNDVPKGTFIRGKLTVIIINNKKYEQMARMIVASWKQIIFFSTPSYKLVNINI